MCQAPGAAAAAQAGSDPSTAAPGSALSTRGGSCPPRLRVPPSYPCIPSNFPFLSTTEKDFSLLLFLIFPSNQSQEATNPSQAGNYVLLSMLCCFSHQVTSNASCNFSWLILEKGCSKLPRCANLSKTFIRQHIWYFHVVGLPVERAIWLGVKPSLFAIWKHSN